MYFHAVTVLDFVIQSVTRRWQSVPLATSPKCLSSKYSFGLVKINPIQYIL